MALTINNPELEATLTQKALIEGLSLAAYIERVLAREANADVVEPSSPRPLKSLYGVLAKYGPGPSEKDIDENRAEMFRNFARDDEAW